MEKKYTKELTKAKPLFTPAQQKELIGLIQKYIEGQGMGHSADLSERFREKVQMTDIGRGKKLLQILHSMGIREIDRGSLKFTVDEELVQKFIGMRNQNFHGDSSRFESGRSTADKLLCVCLEIIRYLVERKCTGL